MRVGEVWLYFDEDSQKLRPCLIVGKNLEIDSDLTMVKITRRESRCEFDLELEKWEEYGLAFKSTVRCSKIYTMKGKDFKRRLTEIPENKMKEIKYTIVKYIMN